MRQNNIIIIKEIPYGIASRIGNIIYINKNLEKYPKLYQALLNHESKHSNSWNIKDIELDLKNIDLKGLRRDYYTFLMLNPSSLLQFIPIIKYEGKWSFDITLMIFYGLVMIILGIIGGLYGS